MKFNDLRAVLVVCAVAVALIAWFAPKPGSGSASRSAATASSAVTGAQAPAVPPPNPYRYGGRMTQQGETQVLLAKGTAGNLTVAARPGTVLDGTYRVDEVTPTTVVMTYLPLSLRQVVAIDPPEAASVSPEANSGETKLPPPISGLSSSAPSASVPTDHP